MIDFGVEQQRRWERNDVLLSSSPNLGVGSAALPPPTSKNRVRAILARGRFECARMTACGRGRRMMSCRPCHNFQFQVPFSVGIHTFSAPFVDDTIHECWRLIFHLKFVRDPKMTNVVRLNGNTAQPLLNYKAMNGAAYDVHAPPPAPLAVQCSGGRSLVPRGVLSLPIYKTVSRSPPPSPFPRSSSSTTAHWQGHRRLDGVPRTLGTSVLSTSTYACAL